MTTIGNNKNMFIQAIKGLCIILVVCIHLPLGQSHNWSSFLWISIRQVINLPVATFFFLSAYYAKSYQQITQEGFLSYYKTRLKRLLYPYLIWGGIYIFIIPYLREHSVPDNWWYLFVTGYGPAYFLLALSQFTLLTPFLQKWKSNRIMTIILTCITPIYISFYYSYNFYTGEEFKPEQVLCFPWFIFYFWGLKMQSPDIQNRIKTIPLSTKIGLFFLILPISLIESFFIFYKTGIFSFAISQITLGSILYSLICCILLITVKPQQERATILSKIGNYSLGILMMHPLFNWIYKFIIIHYVRIIDYNAITGQMIAHAIILFLSVASSYYVSRLLSRKYPQYSLYLGLK